MQTSIVAKPTEKQRLIVAISSRNLHFYQIHYGYNAKSIFISKDKNSPCLIYSVDLAQLL